MRRVPLADAPAAPCVRGRAEPENAPQKTNKPGESRAPAGKRGPDVRSEQHDASHKQRPRLHTKCEAFFMQPGPAAGETCECCERSLPRKQRLPDGGA